MPGAYLKPVYTLLSDYHSQPALSCDRQTRTMVQKVAVRTANAFNMNSLHFYSVSRRPCSLAVAFHARFRGLVALKFNHREIFECTDFKFTVSSRSKQA